MMMLEKHTYLFIFCVLCLGLSSYAAAMSEDGPHFPREQLPSVDPRLNHADELLDACLYSQAVTRYQEILEDINSQSANEKHLEIPFIQMSMQTRFHLGQAYYALEKYQNALPPLNENALIELTLPSQLEEIRRNSIYLIALVNKEMGNYSEACKSLQLYLSYNNPTTLNFYDEARFELGLIYFLMGNSSEAKRHFEDIQNKTAKTNLYILAQLYLSRISLSQGHFEQAYSILSDLSPKLSKKDALHYELCYLQGEASFQLHEYSKAISFFEEALPKHLPEKCSWFPETLYHLGWSYLKIGDDALINRKDQEDFFNKSEEAFQKLLSIEPNERVHLALGQCYLTQANRLKNEEAYAKAESVLSHQDVFHSKEGQAHALLLRAAAAPSYELRDKFYRQLTQEENSDSSFYANGWYMRAMNDFEYGLQLLKSQKENEGKELLEHSSLSFRRAFELFQDKEKSQAGSALKYQALAYSYSGKIGDLQAMRVLEELMEKYPDHWHSVEAPDEILYLHGFFASRLTDREPAFAEIADRSLKEAAAYKNGKFGDLALLHLGAMYYRHGNFSAAESVYLGLINQFPTSAYSGEAWFWSALCADKLQQDPQIGKQRRRNAFEYFPLSPYAAEAYFTFYSYQDYLQGERASIKHLQNFIAKYPDTPFILEANYLLGLDYKRDRKTPEGKWIRKKSLTEAIDAFQEVETLFDSFAENETIPADRFEYYLNIRYRATLERAMANLAIAEESQGAKRQIYLEYAEEVFKQLVQDFKLTNHPYTKFLFRIQVFPSIYEESYYWLAQTYIKGQNDDQAEQALAAMLDLYQQAKITRGYYLSRVRFEQGKMAMRHKDFLLALQFFKLSEEAAKGNVLGTDQKLDLWIQQSLCYRGLDQYDQAILILSKVVNDDAISSLRLKAMYLRAETYELQGRPELARKQLESMIKKGGLWALKAQEKLEKDYGY